MFGRRKPLGIEVVLLPEHKSLPNTRVFGLHATRTPKDPSMFFTTRAIRTGLDREKMEGKEWGQIALSREGRVDRWTSFYPYLGVSNALREMGIASNTQLKIAEWMQRRNPDGKTIHDVSVPRRKMHLAKMGIALYTPYSWADYAMHVREYVKGKEMPKEHTGFRGWQRMKTTIKRLFQ